MNTQNQIRKIDFLQLSDSEKTSFIKEVKEILRQRIEEAKLLQELTASNRIATDNNLVDF